MIEDPELRVLFQAESEERIAHLKDGLRQLETEFSQELVEGIFRDAHTIKGAARMLSISEIEALAHQMESSLDLIRKGTNELTPQIKADLFLKLKQIEMLVAEAVAVPKKQQKKAKVPEVPSTPHPLETNEPGDPEPISLVGERALLQTHANPVQSATVRVTKKQITEITSQAGDLTVAKNRITTIVDHVEQTLAYVEKALQNWSISKETKGNNSQYVEIETTLKEIEKRLSKLRDNSYEDVYKLSVITTTLVSKIRRLGLVPLSKLFDLFPRMVTDLAQSTGKEIEFVIHGEDITVDKKIIEEMKDPIMHILRNAVSHGIESPLERKALSKPEIGHISLKAQQISHTIVIEIIDDGRGLDVDKIKQKAIEKQLFSEDTLNSLSTPEIYSLIFIPGFSTAEVVSDISGRGVGMDVVKSNVENLQGTIQVESQLGHGCHFIIELPTTVLTTHVSIVEIYGKIYAIPIEGIDSVCLISIEQIFQIDNQDVFLFKEQPVSVALLANLLNIPPPEGKSQNLHQLSNAKLSCIVFNIRGRKLAVIVDDILDEQQVVLVPFNALLNQIPNLAGATTLKTGQVCVVIDPLQLVKGGSGSSSSSLTQLKESLVQNQVKKRILLVDDSYAIRLYCKKVLEQEGFEVEIAEDGEEALKKLDEGGINAIVSDVQMPKMDGLTLTTTIRKARGNFVIPIILMTTLESDADRRKGMEVGASAYLTKSGFSQKELISTLRNLL